MSLIQLQLKSWVCYCIYIISAVFLHHLHFNYYLTIHHSASPISAFALALTSLAIFLTGNCFNNGLVSMRWSLQKPLMISNACHWCTSSSCMELFSFARSLQASHPKGVRYGVEWEFTRYISEVSVTASVPYVSSLMRVRYLSCSMDSCFHVDCVFCSSSFKILQRECDCGCYMIIVDYLPMQI